MSFLRVCRQCGSEVRGPVKFRGAERLRCLRGHTAERWLVVHGPTGLVVGHGGLMGGSLLPGAFEREAPDASPLKPPLTATAALLDAPSPVQRRQRAWRKRRKRRLARGQRPWDRAWSAKRVAAMGAGA
jgi:hypothetical protein